MRLARTLTTASDVFHYFSQPAIICVGGDRKTMFVQSLDGAWSLRQCGADLQVGARVPGCVHVDLMRAKVIPDPFRADNEARVAWVHECDWEYERSFRADACLFECDRVFLECDGIDTIGEITLNGVNLGRVENMYVPHRFDVTESLTRGDNVLRVRLTSPVNHSRPLIEKEPLFSPGESIPGANYTRKSPSQWGWDWAPKLPTSGIWRSIRLAGYETARIEDVRVRQSHRRNGSVTLDIETSVERYRRAPCAVEVRVTDPLGGVEIRRVRIRGAAAKCSIDIHSPQLWWPNGCGEQPLYNVEAALVRDDRRIHSFSRRVGLRRISLEQKRDRHGYGFALSVNGVKLFARGANWVPADQFPCRISDDQYRHLVSSAAAANMNMLRVWGGGIYEDERFYDLCDEYGILVWQDFMFACSLYPVNDQYLANCRLDIEHNIVRLRNRACLALWCGNNEIEGFLAGGHAGEASAKRKREYLKLFHEFIPSIVGRLDPDTPYWPSSPSSHGRPFENPNGQESGDGHYWDVWHNRAPFTAYRNQFHRFTSEFGFESLPAIETVRAFAGPEDLNITSPVVEAHQKNGAGNGLILSYMAQTFRMPRNFETMCYVSQLLQAEAMRFGVEHWRRNRGRCMGALYWQLNDCWPACSWSGIDYYGRWKALHYFARRFYAPVLLSVKEEGHRAEIHVTNDTTKPVKIEVNWSLQRFDGTVVRRSKLRTRVDAEHSARLTTLDFSDELRGDAANDCALVCDLVVNGREAGTSLTTFVPPKQLNLPRARVVLRAGRDEGGPYLEALSEAAARFVCLRVPGHDVLFSDNYFDLPAGRAVKVRVLSEITDAALAKARAYSLRDSY